MKANLTNALLIISLNFALVACSKTETSDMMFKQTVSDASTAVPSPGENPGPMQEPSVVIENGGTDTSTTGTGSVTSTTGTGSVTSTTGTGSVTSTTGTGSVTSTTGTGSDTSTTGTGSVTSTTGTGSVTSTTGTGSVTSTTGTGSVTSTTGTDSVTSTTGTGSVTSTTGTGSVVVVENVASYPESAVPVCKFDITIGGLGSAAKVAIASAPKEDLLSSVMKGFESLSSAELSSMRNSIETMKSGNNVLFLNESASFDKAFFKNSSMIMVVIHSKPGKVIDMSGLGKNAQFYIMIVSQEHNTVCLDTNGNSSMGELSVTAQTTPDFAARASVFISGNGSVKSYIKVAGGHRSGSRYEGQSIKDSSLTFITEGKDDTFTSVKGNGVEDSEFVIKINGKDKTGFGMSANHINSSKMRMEIQGEDDVQAMMNVKSSMRDNEVSGWLKAKSGGKVDPLMEDSIELMPLP